MCPTLCCVNMYHPEGVTMDLFSLKFTSPLFTGAKLLCKTKLSIMFCILGCKSQIYLKLSVHGLENRSHTWRKKRKQAVFEMDFFKEPVCGSSEIVFWIGGWAGDYDRRLQFWLHHSCRQTQYLQPFYSWSNTVISQYHNFPNWKKVQ